MWVSGGILVEKEKKEIYANIDVCVKVKLIDMNCLFVKKKERKKKQSERKGQRSVCEIC